MRLPEDRRPAAGPRPESLKAGSGGFGGPLQEAARDRSAGNIASGSKHLQAKTVLPHVRSVSFPRTTIYTDELGSYNRLGNIGYQHRRIHHAQQVYVMGTFTRTRSKGFPPREARDRRDLPRCLAQVATGTLERYVWRYVRSHHGCDLPPALDYAEGLASCVSRP